MQHALNLYEKDFYAWTQNQAKFIKEKAFNKLDLNNLFEEIESMGKQEKRELGSRIAVLLMHLLKWKYQPSRQCKSWRLTIKEQRLEVKEVLRDNPSLKANLTQYIDDAYQKAILKASDETNLDEDVFPKVCEWTVKQILDNDFFPN